MVVLSGINVNEVRRFMWFLCLIDALIICRGQRRQVLDAACHENPLDLPPLTPYRAGAINIGTYHSDRSAQMKMYRLGLSAYK